MPVSSKQGWHQRQHNRGEPLSSETDPQSQRKGSAYVNHTNKRISLGVHFLSSCQPRFTGSVMRCGGIRRQRKEMNMTLVTRSIPPRSQAITEPPQRVLKDTSRGRQEASEPEKIKVGDVSDHTQFVRLRWPSASQTRYRFQHNH